jgi:hypothetical protein
MHERVKHVLIISEPKVNKYPVYVLVHGNMGGL